MLRVTIVELEERVVPILLLTSELTRPIWKESTGSMLSSHFLPGLKFLAAKIREIVDEEARLRSEWQLGKDTTDLENNLQEVRVSSLPTHD